MNQRRAFALLAGLTAVLLGLLVALGTGQDGRRDPASPPAAPEPTAPAPAAGSGGEEETVVPAADGEWVGTWSAAPTGSEPGTRDGLAGRSIRNVVRASAGGTSTRVELSNRYGTRPVTFTHVTVALAAPGGGPEARADSMRDVTFGEHATVTIPAGESVVSDPVDLAVAAGDDVLVTVYAPDPSGPVTHHRVARQPVYVADGDLAGVRSGAPFREDGESWRYVTAVHVLSPDTDGAVVVLGDSLTDGVTSTPGANRRWTDVLARRLREDPRAPDLAVLNEGISGNRLLRDGAPDREFNGASGLRRLATDVLPQAGVRTVVVQLGINDIILQPRKADAGVILTGLRLLADQARAEGLRVVGATLAPFGGHGAYTEELERVRQQVNAAIRAGGVFDAVVDFDAALRDPALPQRLLPRFDSGDGLHPNDAGYAAMAAAVAPAGLLGGGAQPTL
ncbi:SGNH/GDSL hydrolase family protein [Streptomyces sp. URMC 129]|uniref:SGNH/GDSL hydrolase family protein n=1 Tax=Streptomyces sp. URMC 129 TaxID=3423407 RepID=UPI003F1A1583